MKNFIFLLKLRRYYHTDFKKAEGLIYIIDFHAFSKRFKNNFDSVKMYLRSSSGECLPHRSDLYSKIVFGFVFEHFWPRLMVKYRLRDIVYTAERKINPSAGIDRTESASTSVMTMVSVVFPQGKRN